MIDVKDLQIRDPFIVASIERQRYFLFGTTDKNPWNNKGTGFDAYESIDLQHWEGPFTVFSPPEGFWGTHDFWAPEVHRYRQRFYMFASFIAQNRKRATHIFVSDDVLGPYEPLTADPITPNDWQCLDGTLYIDESNNPWVIFCHEWVEVNDGEIHAMPLSSDLTHAIDHPRLLFKASEASWTRTLPRRDGSGFQDARVTDGPFLHRQTDGKLIMLWSSIGQAGYAMGCAISDNQKILGPWRQIEKPLIETDGGHGMAFRSFDERLFITYHCPNKTPLERFTYHEVKESSNGLVLATQGELE